MVSQLEVLLFSGYNQRGVISFCRFCEKNNVGFNIIALEESDTILKTNYKTQVKFIRETKELLIDDFLKYKKLIPNTQLLIIPSSEYLNRFLLKNKASLSEIGYLIPLCEPNLYHIISDKYSFGNLCKNYNITVPSEYNLDKELIYPFVIKPLTYSSSTGSILKPSIIFSTNDFENFIQKNDLKDFYLQEFIGGSSYYLLYYFRLDGSYTVFSQENLIQQSNGRSIVAAQSSDIHKNPISKQFSALFLDNEFTGLVMVELKFYKNQFYMIEANPRLWGPSQLILDAQMNLFESFLNDYGLLDGYEKLNYKVNVKYFWSGGIIEDQRKQESLAFHSYSKELFFNDYTKFCAKDIYAYPDTFEVYSQEKDDYEK
ncbi:hypothetical protein JAO76_16380 [Pontibacter sp. BT310]|uniref:ATP-grasp domain-containing protein n=1 Tax=Pontibacter populi TaxID=890055 RepID=A0ABS6XG68_9BACT|nr:MULTISPECIES: ATP-grasp domain-containing protein [Pontibacter]MBJ6119786.1 hypothetical protein [Pontibacter sp. BT310]MBR0572215.1 hypothetical protein [Microvirga sp. STS03]MBW3366639.1 hypothetical protein [Pontibacter populi]